MTNTEIQNALIKISSKYSGPERDWLREKNPVALRQIEELQDKIDLAILNNDNPNRFIIAWQQTWLFWIQNWRLEVKNT